MDDQAVFASVRPKRKKAKPVWPFFVLCAAVGAGAGKMVGMLAPLSYLNPLMKQYGEQGVWAYAGGVGLAIAAAVSLFVFLGFVMQRRAAAGPLLLLVAAVPAVLLVWQGTQRDLQLVKERQLVAQAVQVRHDALEKAANGFSDDMAHLGVTDVYNRSRIIYQSYGRLQVPIRIPLGPGDMSAYRPVMPKGRVTLTDYQNKFIGVDQALAATIKGLPAPQSDRDELLAASHDASMDADWRTFWSEQQGQIDQLQVMLDETAKGHAGNPAFQALQAKFYSSLKTSGDLFSKLMERSDALEAKVAGTVILPGETPKALRRS